MAIPDPIPTLTVPGLTVDLVRTGMTDSIGSFRSADREYLLTVQQQYRKRERYVARIDRNFIAADPFVEAQSNRLSHSCYIVWDSPTLGVSVDDNAELGMLLSTFLSTSEGENEPTFAERILSGEH